jgi:stress-induced morphogen
MAISIMRGQSDLTIECIKSELERYQADHPHSKIDLYRQNPVSVRVRVVDPEFEGRSKVERSDMVWKYLENLTDDCQSDISMLVLLAPDEMEKSFSNLEFEDPIPSIL